MTINTAKTTVQLQQLSGKKILGIANNHAVLLDRKIKDGGDDAGFTSSELLLLAIGSCATAGIRRGLLELGLEQEPIGTQVRYADNPDGGLDLIEIEFDLPDSISDATFEKIKNKTVNGGVTRRFAKENSLFVKRKKV